MKGVNVAVAVAAMAGGASARARHHPHDLFRREATMCQPSCITIYSTITGEPTLYFPPVPVPTTSKMEPVPVVPVPTPEGHTITSPGTYTFPPNTVTVSQPTTVVGVTSTQLPGGKHVIGGITTVVTGPTTVTGPVAVVTEIDGSVTTTLSSTGYFCPSAGTCVVAPTTTIVPEDTTVTYPIPTSFESGIYTAPQIVTTITVNSYIFYCPYTSSGLPSTEVEKPTLPLQEAPKPSPTAEETPVIIVPVLPTPDTPAPIETETQTQPPPSLSQPDTPEKSEKPEVPEKHEKPTTPPPSGGKLGSDNDHYAMTYTPYDSDVAGKCKSSDAVDSDVSLFPTADIYTIRTYATDCNAMDTVGGAVKKYGMQLQMGIFIKEDGCTYETPSIREQVNALTGSENLDVVSLVYVGNEALHSKKCSAASLATLIDAVRQQLQGAGYTGPVGTADTVDIWLDEQNQAALCDKIDVVGAQSHPYFNLDTPPSKAGEFVLSQVELVKKACPGKQVLVSETGWPTDGAVRGLAVPGFDEQAIAIKSLRKSVGAIATFFSFRSDHWKPQDTECQCERAWGCGHLFIDGLSS